MATKIRKMLSMLLLLCVMMNALPLQALAAEGEGVPATQPVVDVVMTITPDAAASNSASAPKTESAPQTESAPKTESEPKTEPAPQADSEPKTEEKVTVTVETQAGNNEKVEVESTLTVTPVQGGSTEGGSTEGGADAGAAKTTETVKIEGEVKADDFVTESGMIVDVNGSANVTAEKTTDAEGNESYQITGGTVDATYSSNNGTDYEAKGGYEATYETTTNPNVAGTTVDVPLTDEEGKNVNTEEYGTPSGTVTDMDVNDPKKGANDGTYDYTTTTVDKASSVTVTTNEVIIAENQGKYEVDKENGYIVEIIETVDADGNKVETRVPVLDGNGMNIYPMKHVQNETGVIQGGEDDNMLFHWNFRPYKSGLPFSYDELQKKLAAIEQDKLNGTNTSGITPEEGYEYVYIGSDISSQIMPSFLFDYPSFEGEEPVFTIGDTKYYKHDYGTLNFDSYYDENGNEIMDENAKAIFGVPQQFLLYDPVTKQLITAYCADADTETVNGYSYNMENVEDADYYSDAEAAMIRAIANHGYWGTKSELVKDEDGNEAYKFGSLEAMREKMRDSNMFTDEELASLNDGIALAATQMAIWAYSNKMNGMQFLNATFGKDAAVLKSEFAGSLLSSATKVDASVAEDTELDDAVDLLFKIYEYLTALEPETATGKTEDGEDEKPTTADTIINPKNFIDEMNITVIKKDETKEVNKDQNKDNDAYVTNLSFALVVEPSTERGDDLVVRVIDAYGNEVAAGRIAGKNKDGETLETLEQDENGNYVFPGITMYEGEANSFNLTLEGIQHLKEGVYLYTSEVRTDVDDEGNECDVSSQTLVGVAGGAHAVDVSMSISFELDVDEDVVVAKEHVWRTEKVTKKPGRRNPPTTPRNTPGGSEDPADPTTTTIIDDEVPLADGVEVILDEEVPLAAAPETGDNSIIWLALSLMSALCMCGMTLSKKKYEA